MVITMATRCAAVVSPYPKQVGSEAEAQLVPRAGAHSDGSSCTDGLRPVTFSSSDPM